MRLLLIVAILCCWFPAGAQTRAIDSLLHLVHAASDKQEQLQAMLRLCDEYQTLNRDTFDYYAYRARELARQQPDMRKKWLAELAVANNYFRWGWMDSCQHILEPVLAANPPHQAATRDIFFKATRQKGLSLGMSGHYRESLDVFYTLLREAEKYRDSLVAGENMNTVASIALARKQPAEGLIWLRRALSLSTGDARYTPILAAIYTNMGDAYHQLHREDSALYYSREGCDLFRRTGLLSNLALALQRRSAVLMDAGKLREAEACLLEMAEARRQTGDEHMFADDNISLIRFYMDTDQLDKAIRACKSRLVRGPRVFTDTLQASTVHNNTSNTRLMYLEMLAACYKLKGTEDSARMTLEELIAAKDTMYELNSAQAIAELQTRYEVQKKEATIAAQKLDITQKNFLFYGSLALLSFGSVIAWLIFRNHRRKTRMELFLIQEKEKRAARRAVHDAEERERKRIAADLHDNLGSYAASIKSHTDEMKSMPGTEDMNLGLLQHNAQQMVSLLGDTIWALRKDAMSFADISDRTKVFLQRLQPVYPRIRLRVEEQLEEAPAPFSPAHAYHLFMIIQEAVNNAIRHSGGDEVVVRICGGSSWSVHIRDNGHGMDQASASPGGGNGRYNMESRAASAGATVRWENRAGGGTVVVVTANTN